MKVTYYTNNGSERAFERDTLDECISTWVRIKSLGNAGWARVYINGIKHWI